MSEPKIYDSFADAFLSDFEDLKWYEKIYYFFVRKFDDAKYAVRSLSQRVKYGFPDWHWYEFKTWHSEQVVPRLKRLRNNLNGFPSGLTEELWAEYLDAMIWSFEHHNDHVLPEYPADYDHRVEKTVEDGMTIITPVSNTGYVNFDKILKHKEKVQYGLNLFAEYYINLWD